MGLVTLFGCRIGAQIERDKAFLCESTPGPRIGCEELELLARLGHVGIVDMAVQQKEAGQRLQRRVDILRVDHALPRLSGSGHVALLRKELGESDG